MCLYDTGNQGYSLATSLSVPAGDMWAPGRKGWKYSDKTGSSDGVKTVKLKPGEAGKPPE